MMNSMLKNATIVGLCALASACGGMANGPDVALTVQEEHPISVDSQTVTLTLTTSNDGSLSRIDQARLNAFADAYLSKGHGPVAITTPSGGLTSGAAASMASKAEDALYKAGVDRASMRRTSYAASTNGGDEVIISYTHYVATPSACGVWEGMRERDYKNLRSPNFGCAAQSNLAAMIVDPRDLVAPATMTAPDAAIRIRGVRAFRQGEITATQKDSEIKTQVAE